MALAVGHDFSLVVTENGNIYSFGRHFIDQGQLGNGDNADVAASHIVPILLDKDLVFDEHAVEMVSAGDYHSACVTADGSVWTWGSNRNWQLGLGHCIEKTSPQRIRRNLFGDSRALMVACGNEFSMVLTTAGRVWTCGENNVGQLGLHDLVWRHVLVEINPATFDNRPIGMITAGFHHCLALGRDDGMLWTWGWNGFGELALGDQTEADVVTAPTLVSPLAFGGNTVRYIDAKQNSMVITSEGELWASGLNSFGILGLGTYDNYYTTMQRVGGADVFGTGGVKMVSCGTHRTLIVACDGTLWSTGHQELSRDTLLSISHGDQILCAEGFLCNVRPGRVDREYFAGDDVIVAATGIGHSIAVTAHGRAYCWGQATCLVGHNDMDCNAWGPCPITGETFDGERIGRWHVLQKERSLAFAMGTHAHLAAAGDHTEYSANFPDELLQNVFAKMRLVPREGTTVGFQNLLG